MKMIMKHASRDPGCRGDLTPVATIWSSMEPEVKRNDMNMKGMKDPNPGYGDP